MRSDRTPLPPVVDSALMYTLLASALAQLAALNNITHKNTHGQGSCERSLLLVCTGLLPCYLGSVPYLQRSIGRMKSVGREPVI